MGKCFGGAVAAATFVAFVMPALAAPTMSYSSGAASGQGSTYVGGRGLITAEGPTGMFLNPTSGTAAKGQLTAQVCALIFEAGGDTRVGYGFLATYGFTDWFEAGVFGLLVDDIEPTPTDDFRIGAGQVNFRLRLMRDEGAMPEISVGGMAQEGNDLLARNTIFIAASKGFSFGQDNFIRGVRFHLGFRQFWQDSDVNEANGSIGYVGGELELPLDLYLVGEVSNKDDVFTRRPYSVGVQWRDPRGYGFSLALTQPGNADHAAVYAGIGVNF